MNGACNKCGATEPVATFYAGQRVCKECVKARVRKHYRETIDAQREYEKKRNATPSRKAHFRNALRKHCARYPEKYIARTATNNAIRDGRLVRHPCEKCGSLRSQAHHDDYSRPLDVRWLCKPHHDEHHGKVLRALEMSA